MLRKVFDFFSTNDPIDNEAQIDNEASEDETPLADKRLANNSQSTKDKPIDERVTNVANAETVIDTTEVKPVINTDDVKRDDALTTSTTTTANELTTNTTANSIQNEKTQTVTENKPVLSPSTQVKQDEPTLDAKPKLKRDDEPLIFVGKKQDPWYEPLIFVGEQKHPLAFNEVKEEPDREKKLSLSNAFRKIGQSISNALNAFANALKNTIFAFANAPKNTILVLGIIGNQLMNAFTSEKKNKKHPKFTIRERLKQKKERSIADDKIRQKQSYHAYLEERKKPKKPKVMLTKEELQNFLNNHVNKKADILNPDNSFELLSKDEIYSNKLAKQSKFNQSKISAGENYRAYVANQKQSVDGIQQATAPAESTPAESTPAESNSLMNLGLTFKKLYQAFGRPIQQFQEKRAAKKALPIRSRELVERLTEHQDNLFYQYKGKDLKNNSIFSNKDIFNTSTQEASAQAQGVNMDSKKVENSNTATAATEEVAASAIKARV